MAAKIKVSKKLETNFWAKLNNYYLSKFKNKSIGDKEKREFDYLAHLEFLLEYFNIALSYLSDRKIQKEVEERYPNYTGYENQYWIFYHYENFGNWLYSYTLTWAGYLREVLNITKAGEGLIKLADNPKITAIVWKPKANKTLGDLIREFLKPHQIKKILNDRHNALHQQGFWRRRRLEPLAQDWKNLIKDLKSHMTNAGVFINWFHNRASQLIYENEIERR